MYAIKVGVRQGSGGFLERHVANGGKVNLAQGERLVLFEPPENVEVTLGAHGEYSVRLKGGGELVVASAASLPELAVPGSETKESLIVFAPQAAVEEGDAHVGEPLSIHQASVADTGFLHRDAGGDFGLGQLLQMASFSAESGEGLSASKNPDFSEWEAPAPVMNGDDGGEANNVSPVVDGVVDLGSMSEDGSLSITAAELLAHASDIDGDALSVTGLTVASGNGVLTDNGDGTWTFAPAADWNGAVSFDYTVSDGQGGTAPATAALTVDPANDALVVAGSVDLGSMSEDGSLTITAAELLAHASDIDGDALSVTGLTVASGSGDLTDNGDGTWTFAPAVNWNGAVSFDYTVSDGQGGTAPATAALTVDPVNDAPVVAGSVDLGSMSEDGSLTITAAELLAHASDIDGDALSVTGLTVASGNGVLTDNGDGTWTFAPAADWNGAVSFDYTVSDGQGGTAPATAALTVDPVNDALVVAGSVDLGSMSEDGSLTITAAELLAHASDIDGDALSVTGLTVASGSGDLTDNGDGTWTFAPTADWHGSVSFDYTVSDGHGGTAPATAALTVDPVNDAPVVEVNSLLLVNELAARSLTGSLSATDVDNAASDLGYTITQGPANGVLLLDGVEITDFSQPVFTQADLDADRVSFRFNTPQIGDEIRVIEEDSFVFTVDDGSLSTGEATFHILNGTVQVWGTNEADDLTGVANFSREGVTFKVYGLDGNDTLRGGAGADLIDGGLGLDFADYRDSASWVAVDLNIQDGTTAQSGGGADNDALGDTLIGIEHLIGSNNASHGDVLTGNAAGNHLIGLDGDDTLVGGAGNDTLVGGAGADVLSGGSGTRDLADYSASTAWVNVDLTRQDGTAAQTGGGAGNHAEGDILTGIEDVNGSAYADSILGNTAINVLYGYGGNDTIFAGNGNDTVHGGDGDDFIDGGGHADELFGDSGNDTIYGGDSIDTLFGGAGDDVLYGHRSDGGSDGNQDLLLGGTGNDTLVSLSTVRSKLIGCQGADRIMGGGIDYVSYELTGDDFTVNRGESVYVDLRIQDGVTAQSGGEDGNDAIGDVLTGIRHILGTYGMTGDTLIGNDEANEIYGLDGDDLLVGGGGNDTLWGNDHNDTLEGGAGADFLWGGMHYDMVSYLNAAQGVSIDLRNQSNYGVQSGAPGGEEVGDQLWYIDGVIGSAHDDTLIGSSVGDEAFAAPDSWAYLAASNRLEGGAGNDLLMGLGAPDTLDGGEGIDTADYSLSEAAVYVDLNLQDSHTAQTGGGAVTVTLSTIDDGTNPGVLYGGNHAYGDVLISIENLTGSTYNDTLIGNGGDNVLSGLAGDDSLVGGGGNDTLIGGAGNDTLQGGDGADLIRAGAGDVVDGGAGHDVLASEDEYLDVSSFTAITGVERIDLTGACKGLTVSGAAILSNGVADPAGSGLMALMVTGDAGDSVARLADGGWTWTQAAPEVAIDGQTYVLYEAAKDGQTVRLYVQTGLNEAEVAGGAIQIWGTPESDDLTTAWDFNDSRYAFHVQALDGNDTMRGGSGADTLDGGGQSYAVNWLYTQDGGDTVDYGASSASVDIDLTRATQSGGHAEGDTLIGVENVIGSAYNDSIVGDASANLLAGLAGDDILLGGDGNDTLRGGAGADMIDGGLGLDFADYRESASWVAVDLNIQDGTTAQSGGGADNDALGDTLIGIEHLIGSNDASYGDVLTGNAAGNHLIGLDGDDTLIGNSGNDTLVGGAGADRLNGGSGTRDLADYSASTAWVNVDLTRQDGTAAQIGGGAGNHAEGDILTGIEDVNGSAYADSILGSTAINILNGYGGNDTIFAGNGNDTVHGGDGDDVIDGGGHADELFGDSGNDTIYGGDSIDTLFGGAGDDMLYGHRSDGGSDGNQDLLLGGTGNDTLVSLSTVRSKLIGCQGADRIMGGGIDYVSYELTGDDFTVNYGQSVYVDLSIQDGVTAQSGGEEGNDAVGDVLTGIRHVLGTYGMTGDTLIGNDEANEIYGLDGDDLLVGGGGNDTLWGNDHNDTLEGGAGADFLWGGMHYDMVSYLNAAQGVSIDLRNQSNYGVQSGAPGGEEVGDQLWYIDGVIGSAHDDTLIGSSVGDEAFAAPDSWAYLAASNRLEGGAGDDLLMGLGGLDTLDGGEGIDTADYSLSEAEVYVDLNLQDSQTAQTGGGTVTSTLSTIDDGTNPGVLYGGNHGYGDVLISIENLTGSAYDDTLIGNGGDNVLSGLAGDDSLIGGGGNDTLIGGFTDSIDGGAGFDTFRLEGHAGTGSALDLTAMNVAGRITGIEQIDIAGDADDANTLTLKASDVLDTTGGTDTLWVHGDGNDSVTTTDTGWTHLGVEAGADGHQYDHYTGYAGSTLVNLMIDTDIAVQDIVHP
ncbi:cadherin-like domain-containing protein [Desulfomicrobium salsuginis]